MEKTINTDQFNVKDCIIAGDECILVTPKDMGVDWTEENKIYRSSIWRKSDMFPVSLGYRKFMNYGEKPDFEPFDFKKPIAIRKIDGSCLIVSKYKGQLIVRTRGTVDATKLENGHEIPLLMEKYPKAFDSDLLNKENHTLLFEWTTPTNRIVLSESQEPTLWLTGVVRHMDNDVLNYKYYNQKILDNIARAIEVKRPERIEFKNDEDLNKFKKRIEGLGSIEGVVIYDPKNEQILKKIKTTRYIQLHRVFTGIKNLNQVVQLWVENGCTYRENFEHLIATNYDWELVQSLKHLIDELYEKWADIQSKTKEIHSFLVEHHTLCRKDKAKLIIDKFGNWSSIAFEILDNKKNKVEKLFELHEMDLLNYQRFNTCK
jgi:hypothetical protein